MDEVPAHVLFTSPDPQDWDLLWPTIQSALAHVGVPVSAVERESVGRLARVPAVLALLDEFPTALTNFFSPRPPRLRIVVHAGKPDSALLHDLAHIDLDDEGQYRPLLTVGFVEMLDPPRPLLDGYSRRLDMDGQIAWLRDSRKLEPSPILALAITPDGSEVITGHSDGYVRRWDTTTGAHAGVLAGPTTEVTAIGISPDGRYIVAGNRDGGLDRWYGTTRDRKIDLTSASVNAIAVTPDGRYVVVGTDDGQVQVWDPEQNTRVRDWVASTSGSVNAIAVSTDGHQVATARGGLAGSACGISRQVSGSAVRSSEPISMRLHSAQTASGSSPVPAMAASRSGRWLTGACSTVSRLRIPSWRSPSMVR